VTRSIHRSAEADLADALRFYKREAGRGVAVRFLAEFERVARLLEENPALGSPTHEGRRSFPLSHFPYSVIYRDGGPGLRILVVRHQSRSPDHGDGRT